MPLPKPPVPDETLTPFDGGLGVLTRDGQVMGHVATSLSTFWSPSSPLRMQWWVWYIVAWSDGEREPSTEDYPPFITVNEIKAGYMEVFSRVVHRSGRYDFAWLPAPEAPGVLVRLGINPGDF